MTQATQSKLLQIETKAFFFDARSDYLPHFRTHTLEVGEEQQVLDLLKKMQEKERIFTYPEEGEVLLRINGIWTTAELSVKEAAARFGREWQIEPISGYRAVKDLVIDESDFIAKHAVLEAFADEEDFAYYRSLKNLYYASGSLPYNEDYFGDSMFVYAHYLMEKYPQKQAEILAAIDHEDGIWLYEQECNRYPADDSDQKIKSLLMQLPQTAVEGYTAERMAYYHQAEAALCARYGVERDEDSQLETIVERIGIEKIAADIRHRFEDFRVAFYEGSFACDVLAEVDEGAKALLRTLGAKVIEFERSSYADGFDIVDTHPEVAFKKAGNIMLDAFDSGAEILVVDNQESHFMFDQNVRALEKAVGRDIRLPVLNIAQMVALATGITDKEKLGLNRHIIRPEFI